MAQLVAYALPLRRNLIIRLTLPSDLTVADAERLAGTVRALAFPPERLRRSTGTGWPS